jgi:quinol monooxygenase YgiN
MLHKENPMNVRQTHTSCRICSAEFVSEEELAEHVRSAHPAHTGAATCGICRVGLADAEALEAHLRHEHGVEVAETVPCLECGLVFAGPDALEEHVDREHFKRAGMGHGQSRT